MQFLLGFLVQLQYLVRISNMRQVSLLDVLQIHEVH